MPDATEAFFAGLLARGAGVLPPEFRGTIRLDLRGPHRVDQWYITLGDAQVSVVREENPSDRPADCVVGMEQLLFDRLVAGRGSVVALTASNRITVEGSLPPVLMLRRFFPNAPGARDPRSLTSGSAA